MEQYTYLVSYSFATAAGGSGFGRVFVKQEFPINTPEHVEQIEAFQNERNGFRCAVLNVVLLDHATADDETKG